MNFKQGEKVICINADNHGYLQRGKMYIVHAVHKCSNCTEPILDVGLRLSKSHEKHFCRKCDSYVNAPNPGVSYGFAFRFVKMDGLLEDAWWQKEELPMEEQLRLIIEKGSNRDYLKREIQKRRIEEN